MFSFRPWQDNNHVVATNFMYIPSCDDIDADETATTQRATNSPPITPPLPPATNSDDEDSLPSTPLPSTVSEDGKQL